MDATIQRIACDVARQCHAEALDLLRELARIPAPSHHEERRARFVCDWMAANGLSDTFIDEANNVICPLGDDGTRDLVVFAAHTDVVFPDEDELPLHEEDGRLFAPGVGDDTANLVSLLLAARHLARNPSIMPDGLGVLIVANSCEEGLGNLKGTKALFLAYGHRIRRYYSFDLYLPSYIDVAVGSCRWRITVSTQGGHSLKDFGRANAIERLCAVVQALYAIELPTDAVCTMNVGTIGGGTTVNAIASQADCLFEFRSTSAAALEHLQGCLEWTIAKFQSDEVRITVESLGVRPASAPSGDAQRRMSRLTYDVLQAITGEEPVCEPASTDANVPLSMGIPANTVGAVRGALLHTRDEWVDGKSLKEGLAVILCLMLSQNQLA
ncbi:MAG: M20/M25/M40 family metallo-hydrolase [Atopobiaceae bacterium]|nr:M20/M25/M40 family metallo-hydrolase [Atopobiaceae bacterium]